MTTRIEAPKRPDLYVVARFLDRLREKDKPWSRSRLQHAVRLNYDLFRSYLMLLEEKGFVEEVPEDGAEGRNTESPRKRTEIRLTAEGHAAHDRLVAWIRDIFGETRL